VIAIAVAGLSFLAHILVGEPVATSPGYALEPGHCHAAIRDPEWAICPARPRW
jgi:hypothetical protein